MTKILTNLLILSLFLVGCVNQTQPTIAPPLATTTVSVTSQPTKSVTPTATFTPTTSPTLQPTQTPLPTEISRSGKAEQGPSGRIIFYAITDIGSLKRLYFIMDPNGGHIVPLDYDFTGSPGWSRDGKQIAIGCEDPYFCIVNADDLYNDFSYPQKYGLSGSHGFGPRALVNQIRLPQACLDIPKEERGLHFSWSPEGKRLALTCTFLRGNAQDKVCIVNLAGESSCWGYADQNIRYIYSAAWAPDRDQLAVSVQGENVAQIFLVGIDGKNPKVLSDGWAPGWSPDGKQIAFMRYGDQGVDWVNDGFVITHTHPFLSGLAVIDRDEQNFHWLIPPVTKNMIPGEKYKDWNLKHINFVGCATSTSTYCHLTWSPDGQYIMFSAQYGVNAFTTTLMRYDLRTQEITIPFALSSSCDYPEWGNYP